MTSHFTAEVIHFTSNSQLIEHVNCLIEQHDHTAWRTTIRGSIERTLSVTFTRVEPHHIIHRYELVLDANKESSNDAESVTVLG